MVPEGACEERLHGRIGFSFLLLKAGQAEEFNRRALLPVVTGRRWKAGAAARPMRARRFRLSPLSGSKGVMAGNARRGHFLQCGEGARRVPLFCQAREFAGGFMHFPAQAPHCRRHVAARSHAGTPVLARRAHAHPGFRDVGGRIEVAGCKMGNNVILLCSLESTSLDMEPISVFTYYHPCIWELMTFYFSQKACPNFFLRKSLKTRLKLKNTMKFLWTVNMHD